MDEGRSLGIDEHAPVPNSLKLLCGQLHGGER